MTDKYIYRLSWEGATERLFEASGLTAEAVEKLDASDRDKIRTKAAQFHVSNARKSHFISDVLSGRILRRTISPAATSNSNGQT